MTRPRSEAGLTRETFPYPPEFQVQVLACTLRAEQPEDLRREILSHLEPRFFDTPVLAQLCQAVLEYCQQYLDLPSLDTAALVAAEPSRDAALLDHALKALAEADVSNADFIRDRVLDWARRQAVIAACREGLASAQNGHPDDFARLGEEIDRALAVGAPSAKPLLSVNAVKLSHVRPEAVSWTWPGRIPRGKLTLLVGDPGLGKSLLTLDVAARITGGGLWPDGDRAEIGNVVLLSAEDGLPDTVRPRVDAAQGIARRVTVLEAIRERDAERIFDLARDLPQLEGLIRQSRAPFVILDPLSAYLGKTDSYRDAEVRSILAPLAALAGRTGSAIVAVAHLTKQQQRALVHRVQGSVAFTAAARAVFAVAADPDDPERKIFACVKSNLAAKPRSLAFRIVAPRGVPFLQWEAAPTDVNVEALFGPPVRADQRSLDQAVVLLTSVLAGGKRVAARVVQQAARQAGVPWRTVERAKGLIGAVSKQDGFHGGWTWSLPTPAAATSDIVDRLLTEEHES